MIPLVLIIFLLQLSSSPSFVQAKESEIFSSIAELERLYRDEVEVVKRLNEYVSVLDTNLQAVRRYVDDFNKISNEESNDAPSSAAEVVANPFNAFHILKRTVVDWESVTDSIKKHKEVTSILWEVMEKGERMPTFDDFVGGSMALVGLQDTYGLNLTEFIRGRLGKETKVRQSPYELSARDLLFLGKAAFNKGLYDRSISWLEMALALSEEEQKDKTVTPSATKEEILPFLETTKRVHDDVLEKRGPSGENWQTFPKPVDLRLANKKKYNLVQKYQPKLFTPLTIAEENENYKSLCRGVVLRSPAMDAPLRCRYLARPLTRSFIGPFQAEEHSLEPYIITINDFMSDSEMEFFRDTVSNRLKRSLHGGKDGGYIATDVRTSKQAWLTREDDGPIVDTINRRVSDATGLLTTPEQEAAELFQVANYGMAGRYTAHTDYITSEDHYKNPFEVFRGNRIATLMVYLEDVEAGGSTVFTYAGVQVKPKKGKAVFWWNLKRDGTGDPLTRHAGCSVLYGSKWITNKWIRSNCQLRTAPCDLNQTSSFTIL